TATTATTTTSSTTSTTTATASAVPLSGPTTSTSTFIPSPATASTAIPAFHDHESTYPWGTSFADGTTPDSTTTTVLARIIELSTVVAFNTTVLWRLLSAGGLSGHGG
ncbi:hypothetical protein DFQ27_001534, partial [Actinomortierella ambigua]